MTRDRSLMIFRDNALDFIADVCDVGFEDLPELARKLQGLRAEIDQLELRACAIAGEQDHERGLEEKETAIPPYIP